MANRIQLRRGIKSKLPTTLTEGEPAYTTDTHELFVGTGSGNVNMGGSQWYTGTALTGTGSGYSYSGCPMVKVGDKYLNTSTGYFYECTTAGSGTNAKWTYKGSLKGATGAQGSTGAAGANGTSAAWHTGTGMSGTGTKTYSVSGAKAGDMYLNTSTGDVYEAASSSSWTWKCNIKGPTGSQGPTGPQGPAGTTAAKLTTARTIDGVDFDGSAAISHYGVCSTAAATATKTVSIPGFKLVTGAVAYVKFSETNTASSPKLNINSTGAKNITYGGENPKASMFYAKKIIKFLYDGTQYNIVGYTDAGNADSFVSADSIVDSNSRPAGNIGIVSSMVDTIDSSYGGTVGGYWAHIKNHQFVIGHNNVEKAGSEYMTGTDGSAFIIGNGGPVPDEGRSNAFRVDFNGKVYGTGSFNSTGADYAEYFEWLDGNPENEDRIGLFVTLDGDKIRVADAGDDYILGAVSGMPGVVGNNHADMWQGMYMTDVFGRVQTHTVHHEAVYNGDALVIPEGDLIEPIINPDYNPDEKYIPREERKEWGVVGLMGQLVVIDDGTCKVNGCCKVADGGTATASDSGWRVIARLDDTHVKVLFR